MQFKKFGKYSVIKTIASGGMADILLSVSLSPTGFGRFVVLKKTLSKFSNNQDFNDMFKNEAKIACNLKHKNITPIYEFGIESDQFFLTMEYISGKNLRELTKKIRSHKKEIGFDNAIYIIKEIASGLNYAHNAIDSNTGLPLNVIHRDISPQNIMVSFEGEIKLIDFGIAKISDTNLTKAGHLKGKFSYMSPEQAKGEKLDERTDIFCLGIVLWEILTDKRLFASDNEMISLRKVRNCEIPSAQKINPKIPTELNTIVMKALNKNQNLRYKTASQFEKDLNLFLNKSYPEYSHYNLIFLIKTIYRKEIMQEREQLKIYSSEFKKYINTLNLEKNLSVSNITSLNKPKVEDTLLNTRTNSVIQDSQLSQKDSDLVSISIIQTAPSTSGLSDHSTQSESTFQIQDPTETSNRNNVNLDRKEAQNQSIANIPNKSEIQIAGKGKEQEMFESVNMNKNNTYGSQSKYSVSKESQRDINYSLKTRKTFFDLSDVTETSVNQKKILIKWFLTVFVGVSAVFAGAYFLFTTEKPIISVLSSKGTEQPPSSIQQTSPPVASAPSPPPSLPKKQAALRVERKIFIRSQPSNARIYINGQFISKYTPYVITVPSDGVYNITVNKEGYVVENFLIKENNFKNKIDIKLVKKKSNNQRSFRIVR